jgi:hypothetical protein
MSVYHDEVEIEDMEYDEETETYYYPCPCGDRFEITKVFLQFLFVYFVGGVNYSTDCLFSLLIVSL